MRQKDTIIRLLLGSALLSAVAFSGLHCGLLADTDRYVVAKLDGKNITRRDLLDVIYDLPDDKRPIIRSRKDYLRVLNQYIDQEIKIPLGQTLADDGEITIDRDVAREQFFKSSGDQEEQNRHMWAIPVPKPGEETELMRIYNLQAVDIQRQKDIIEQETDKIVEQQQGDEAVRYLAMKAYQAGELTLDPESLQLEYELNKDNFKTFEGITFRGLQFPASNPQANEEAAKVRTRLNNGENFDTILDEYLQRDIRFGIESDIENNPSLERFRLFWEQASGTKVGDIVGPVYMPEYARTRTGENGQAIQEVVPASFLVFKVIEYRPARPLTFDEAVPYLAGPIAFAQMMEKLRDDHGVEIYEDKLPEARGGDRDIFKN